MTELLFFEKPGCVGNRRQQQALRSYGVPLQVLDLLAQPWSRERLRPFFGTLPVSDWFNPTAPAITSGRIVGEGCTESQAIEWMLADPLLVRRPLLQWREIRQAGFVDGPVLAALGIRLGPAEDLQSCPRLASEPVCETSS
jgi:nitrogenase-associated protein